MECPARSYLRLRFDFDRGTLKMVGLPGMSLVSPSPAHSPTLSLSPAQLSSHQPPSPSHFLVFLPRLHPLPSNKPPKSRPLPVSSTFQSLFLRSAHFPIVSFSGLLTLQSRPLSRRPPQVLPTSPAKGFSDLTHSPVPPTFLLFLVSTTLSLPGSALLLSPI